MTRQTILRYKLHHVLLWFIVWIIWYYLRYQDYTPGQAVVVTTIKTFDLALMVYLANYFLVPKLLYSKQYALFVTVYILMILVSSIIKMFVIGAYLDVSMVNASTNLKERFYNNVVPHFFIVTAGVAIKMAIDYVRIQTRLTEVAKEKAESELNFLKSQINPHFLFNSLNSVYFLIDRKNTQAREALHKFSDMLRYQLYEVKGEEIPIEKEIGYLKDYIDLQKLRRDNCLVKMDIDEKMNSFSIAPLLLVPFVENSFKHLSHFTGDKMNEICVGLSRQNGELNFTVRNTTEDKVNGDVEEGGIGLGNVKRRLELLYPSKHHLDIMNGNGWYNVNLKIKIGMQ